MWQWQRLNAAILANVRLQEIKGALQVTGTDLDLEIAGLPSRYKGKRKEKLRLYPV
jgi:hypothetical protein